MPWLGAVIAIGGLIVLWMATQSEDWIDSELLGSFTLSELRDMADAGDQFKLVSWYADGGWRLLFAFVVFVALLATLVNFKSRLARTLLWLPVTGPFTMFNLTDGSGRAAPRVLGVLAMLAPAALLAAVWVDLRVEPELEPAVDVPADFDPEDPEQVAQLDVDPQDLEDLQAAAEAAEGGTPDLGTLEDLGFNWEGFSNDDIGRGLWMSFAGVGLVALGAVVGTRKTS